MKLWMTDNEIACIENELQEHDNPIVFEWGSGGSTHYFPKFCKEYHSVEYNNQYFRVVASNIPHNVHYTLREWAYPIPQGHGPHNFKDENHPNIPEVDTYPKDKMLEQFGDFLNHIDKTPRKYDVILVDGRVRILCLEKAINYIKDDGMVFIHDCKSIYIQEALPELVEIYDIEIVVDELMGLRKK